MGCTVLSMSKPCEHVIVRWSKSDGHRLAVCTDCAGVVAFQPELSWAELIEADVEAGMAESAAARARFAVRVSTLDRLDGIGA